MAALKCPNPLCPFQFDPKACPPGATLACPRCQTRFTLGESGAVVEGEPEQAETPAKTRPARRGPLAAVGGPVVAVIAAVLVLGTVTAVTAITLANRGGRTKVDGEPVELVAADQNFAVTPPAGWVADPATQNTLGVNAFAYRHPGGKAWVALAVRDYDTRAPFPTELKGAVVTALDKAFVGVARNPPYAPATLGGKPAEKASFRGETRAGSTPCVGEVTILSYQGVGYWLYAWAVESEAAAVAAGLDQFRDSFRLLDRRESWTPKAMPETIFRGVKNDSLFALSTRSPAWKKADGLDPASETPPAELLLTGKIQAKGDRGPTATVAVFVVNPEGEPQAQAEKLVRARHTPDEAVFGPTAIAPAPGEIEGDPATLGEAMPKLPVARFTVKATGPGASASSDKLVVVSATPIGGKTVVAEAVCPLNQRAIWERRLVQLVGSLGPNR